MDNDIDILRPVSILENNARKFGIVVSRSVIRGKISLPHFRRALQVITRRHPFLGAALYDEGGKAYFKKIKDFYPSLTIKENVNTREERAALYEEELNTPIDPHEKLWRVLLILDGRRDDIGDDSRIEMILSLQHAICDGLSILNLAKEILQQLQALEEGKILYEDRILTVSPPFDEYLSGIIRMPPDDAEGHSDLDYGRIVTIGRDLSIPKDQCRIHYLNGIFPAPDMERLITRCKESDVSIHGILAACMIKAISESIHNPEGKELRLLLRNPVNRRRQVSPPLGNEALLCFVASELIPCPVGKMTSTLDVGRHIMHQLDHDIGIHKALKRYRAVVASILRGQMDKEKYVQALTLSNVGVIDTPADYGRFKLLETNFISSNKHHAIQLSFTTFSDQLEYVLLYTSPWYKTALIHTLSERFREHYYEFIHRY